MRKGKLGAAEGVRWLTSFSACVLMVATIAASTAAGTLPKTVTFTRISLDQGLSQSSISGIAQDPTGFLWFGTQDGLNRFDGDRFRIFRNDPGDPTSISDNIILCVLTSRDGSLWVGTADAGLNHFDPVTETFSRFLHDPENPASIAEDRILSLHEDEGGRLWVGTVTAGLDRLNADGTFTHYRAKPGDPSSLPADLVAAISGDRDDSIWVVTPAGLARLDQDRRAFTQYLVDPASPDALQAQPTFLLESSDGTVWVGTTIGISRFDRTTSSFKTAARLSDSAATPATIVSGIAEDSGGRIWFGTFAGGLQLLDPDSGERASWHHEPEDARSLSSDRVRALFADRSGLVWVGVDGAGINAYDPNTEVFTHIRPGPGHPGRLSGQIVRAIAEARDGTLWVGLGGEGLDRVDRSSGAVTAFRSDPGDPGSLSNDNVFAIAVDAENRTWVGTFGGGLDRFERDGTFTHFRHDSSDRRSLSSNAVRALLTDSSGRLWVGTVGGLDRFEADGSFTHFRHDPSDPSSLSNDGVRCLHEGHDGTIWVGTEVGVSALSPATGRFRRFLHDATDTATLSADRVMSIWEDRKGSVWAGTVLGLSHIDPETGTVRRYREADGLPNDMIYGVLGDREGALWISTNGGLARIEPTPAGGVTPLELRRFDARDGLQSNEFNGAACFASPTGELFFGGINGLTAFFPNRVGQRRYVPPVVLTSFRRLGEPVRFDTALRYVEEIELAHDENFFSFEFAALGFRDPKGNRCAYTLDGFDTGWTEAGSRRMAGYTNVRPGRYTFRVRAASRDGVWSDAVASVRITVRPPWWQTGWAYASYLILGVVALATSAAGLRSFVLSRERKRARLLEAELRAKTAEAQARAIDAEHRRKTHELDEARRLQLSMLPRSVPDLADLEIAVHMDTATEVGGDYYDFKVGEDGSMCVVIGDATGHGLQAGTMVSVMKGLFAAAIVRANLAGFLARCDAVFREFRVGRLHMAASVLEVGGSRAALASAGMPPAYLYRHADNEVEEVLLPGPPLGTSMGAEYAARTLDLLPGDTVLLLSDGLPETLDGDGRPFDYERVRATFRLSARLPVVEIVSALVAAGAAWRGETSLRDDVTLVVIRYQPSSPD